MSFDCFKAALGERGLSHLEHRVLVWVCWKANEDEFETTLAEIANNCECSLRGARDSLMALRRRGHVAFDDGTSPFGDRHVGNRERPARGPGRGHHRALHIRILCGNGTHEKRATAAGFTPEKQAMNADLPAGFTPEKQATVADPSICKTLYKRLRQTNGAPDGAFVRTAIQNQGEGMFGKSISGKPDLKPSVFDSERFMAVKAAWQKHHLHQTGPDTTNPCWEARPSQGYHEKRILDTVVAIVQRETLERVCKAIQLYAEQLESNFDRTGKTQSVQAFSTFFGQGKATYLEYLDRVSRETAQ